MVTPISADDSRNPGAASGPDQSVQLQKAVDARRAALNLLEDAVQARSRAEQLYRELQAGTAERDRARMLIEVQRNSLEMLVQGSPLPQVLAALTREMERHSEHASWAAIHLLDATGTRFELGVAPSLPPGYCRAMAGMDVHSSTGPCCLAVLQRETVVTADVTADPRWQSFATFAQPMGIRAGWSTPIFSSGGEVMGAFASYYPEPREPRSRDQAAVEILTRTVAIAIERSHAQADQARLAAIVTSSEDAIVSKDLHGTVMSWNRGAEQLFGYTAREIVGRSVTMLIPADRLSEETEILQQLRTGQPVHYEAVRRRKDGALLEVSLTVSPIRDAGGAIIGASKVARDITARKQAERDLRASEQRHRSLVSVITDVPWTTDALGQFSSPQPAWAAYTGQSWEEHRGNGWASAFHPDDRSAVQQAWQHACDTGRLYESRGRIWHAATREYRYFVARATPLLDDDGTVREWVGACTDVHEQRQMERRIQQQAEDIATESCRKDEFLAMLSHELRNPLAAIRCALPLLKLRERAGDEDPIQRQAREIIDRQVSNMNRLVNDLLEVSRVVSGRLRLDLQLADLNQIVQHAVETANPLIEQHRHSLTVHPSPDPVWIHADAMRIEEVFVNLLNNAAKYTDAGGRIEVWCESMGTGALAMAQVRVRDNGMGIPPHLLPRVFDLFTQADRSLDRAQGGLGIGLTLVHRLVALHGGSVEAQSPPAEQAQGSEFIVRLPAMSAPGEPVPETHGPVAHEKADGLRVLVVDDNIDHAVMLATSLRHIGCSVQSAYTGPDALKLGQEWRPEVMLLDIGLPGFDGYTVARRLRADPKTLGIRLIAVTGYGRDVDIQKARDAGFDGHMTKPVDLDALEQLMTARATAP